MKMKGWLLLALFAGVLFPSSPVAQGSTCNLEDLRPGAVGWTATTLSMEFTNQGPDTHDLFVNVDVVYENETLELSVAIEVDPYGTTEVFIDFHGPFSFQNSALSCGIDGITCAPEPIEVSVTKNP